MKLEVKFASNTPRYHCDNCYNCQSVFGMSFNDKKNRGCCYYYPKYNLFDIQKMTKSDVGQATLKMILNTPGTTIHNYYVETKGSFDKESYEKFKDDEPTEIDFGDIKDKSIFFKTCPFVVPGKGCSIQPDFRTPVCNFFLCLEVKKSIPETKVAEKFEKEAQSYWQYYNWQNMSLEQLLKENSVNLLTNFNKALEILEEDHMYNYEFPDMKVIVGL